MICNLITKVYTELQKGKYGIICDYSYTDLLLQSLNDGKCVNITPCEAETVCTTITSVSCAVTITQITTASVCGNLTITQIT